VIEHLGAALHPVALDGCAIAMVQVLAQTIQIATRAGLDLGRLRAGPPVLPWLITTRSAVSLCDIPLGQVRYGPPKRFLRTRGLRSFRSEARAQLDLGAMCARRSSSKLAAAAGSLANCGSLASQASRVVSLAMRSRARANEAGRGPARYSRKSSSLRSSVRWCGEADQARAANSLAAWRWPGRSRRLAASTSGRPPVGEIASAVTGAESERVFMDFRLAAAGIEASEQGQVPEKLAGSRAHRRIVEAIAEPAAAVEQLGGVFQLSLARGLPSSRSW